MFKKDVGMDETMDCESFTLPYLQERVKELIDEIANQDIHILGLSKKEAKKRQIQKHRMHTALRTCAANHSGSREYVKDYIEDVLQRNLLINEKSIHKVIPFHEPEKIPTDIKSVILFSMRTYEELCLKYKLDKEKKCEEGLYYEVNKEDIDLVYYNEIFNLSFVEKLNILAQIVFQNTFGNSVADVFMYDDTLDGISGGCSGISNEQYNYMEELLEKNMTKAPKSYESLWVFFKGKPIHHTYLSFQRKEELIRVCKNLYINGSVGHLHSQNGVKQTYLYDGSRSVVARPNYAAHWCFFIRKFSSSKKMTLEELFPYPNNHLMKEIIRWSIKGLLNIIYSGDQNSGKTTLLKNSLFEYVDLRYPVRTAETEFELWANNLHPERTNVVGFRKTGKMTHSDAINALKKMDAGIIIMGEVSTMDEARAFLELILAGTKMVACSIHTPTTQSLIEYFRAALMGRDGGFCNEIIAEQQVVNNIHLDIHTVKGAGGKRYIDRITEIIPIKEDFNWPEKSIDIIAEGIKHMVRRKTFEVRNLIEFRENQFVLVHPMSERLVSLIARNLETEDKENFFLFHEKCKELCLCNRVEGAD